MHFLLEILVCDGVEGGVDKGVSQHQTHEQPSAGNTFDAKPQGHRAGTTDGNLAQKEHSDEEAASYCGPGFCFATLFKGKYSLMWTIGDGALPLGQDSSDLGDNEAVEDDDGCGTGHIGA